MLNKSNAIALRLHPFSKTSQIVTWLSPEWGRLTTLVKGAHRPKSAFLGQYDLSYTCEIVFYARSHQSLALLRECTPLARRERFRTDWRAAVCASYVCDLVSRVGTAEPHAALYDLTTSTLDALERQASWSRVLYFETRLLSVLGFAPRLSSCVACDAQATHERPWRFVPRQGGVLCDRCREARSETGPDLSPEALALLRTWQLGGVGSPPKVGGVGSALSPRSRLELSAVLGVCLRDHLDVLPPSRRIAMEMVTTQP